MEYYHPAADLARRRRRFLRFWLGVLAFISLPFVGMAVGKYTTGDGTDGFTAVAGFQTGLVVFGIPAWGALCMFSATARKLTLWAIVRLIALWRGVEPPGRRL